MYESNSELTVPAGTKEGLAGILAELLASSVVVQFQTQGYHWNVRGRDFHEYHAFFQSIYEDIEDSIDPTAENIRKLGYDAPSTLEDFIALSCCDSKHVGYDPVDMSNALRVNITALRDKFLVGFSLADSINQQGIADYLAGRIDSLDKWLWQLSAITGADATQVKTFEV